jgi:hypothetical protein
MTRRSPRGRRGRAKIGGKSIAEFMAAQAHPLRSFKLLADAQAHAEALQRQHGWPIIDRTGDDGGVPVVRERFLHNQRYVFVGIVPHTRRDGTRTTLLRWRSACPQCDAPFECSTPSEATRFNPNRRCDEHKRPGQRVRGQG